MNVLDWARSVKPSLVILQQQTGIPALWSAAQSCQESAEAGGASMSKLATEHFNFAGLKASAWQRDEFGCGAVSMGTWECINGQNVDLTDAFCSCRDNGGWETWLKVYAALLTGRYYGGALAYKEDPFLYGYHVWKAGWATDPAYLAGIDYWMTQLYADYADTLPGGHYKPVTVRVNGETVDCGAELVIDRTLIRIRPVAEKLGKVVTWDQSTYTVDINDPPGAPAK